jgi:hypothetical protein
MCKIADHSHALFLFQTAKFDKELKVDATLFTKIGLIIAQIPNLFLSIFLNYIGTGRLAVLSVLSVLNGSL